MEEFRPKTPEVKPETKVLNWGEILDGKEAKDLEDSMREFILESGEHVFAGTDKGIGYKDHNEDRVGVLSAENFFTVVDGIGGYSQGDLAAELLTKRLLESPTNVNLAVEGAIEDMAKNGVYNGGAVFISARLLVTDSFEKRLEVFRQGDANILIIKRNGQVIELEDDSLMQKLIEAGEITPDQALYHSRRNFVLKAVSPSPNLKQERPKLLPLISVETGDVVILMSDGVSDNFTAEEISEKVKEGLFLNEIFIWLSRETNKRMQNAEKIIKETGGIEGRAKKGVYSDGFKSEPKRDNRALAITKIK